jgi:NAD(P)-dependent dehydrogenase (short-subunit alcohol dehydrogenase family)
MSIALRILLVGARGTLGRAIAAELCPRHTIISAGRHDADITLDITNPTSIRKGLQNAGELNAVISAAGEVAFVPLAEIQAAPLGESAYSLGLANKLLGQVNLALVARDVLPDGGSITLTAGILSEQPIAAGSSASMVNGALEAYTRAASIELPRGLRINCVSPTVLKESMPRFAPFFRGFKAVAAAEAALAYSRSVEGLQTGQVYRVY